MSNVLLKSNSTAILGVINLTEASVPYFKCVIELCSWNVRWTCSFVVFMTWTCRFMVCSYGFTEFTFFQLNFTMYLGLTTIYFQFLVFGFSERFSVFNEPHIIQLMSDYNNKILIVLLQFSFTFKIHCHTLCDTLCRTHCL